MQVPDLVLALPLATFLGVWANWPRYSFSPHPWTVMVRLGTAAAVSRQKCDTSFGFGINHLFSCLSKILLASWAVVAYSFNPSIR